MGYFIGSLPRVLGKLHWDMQQSLSIAPSLPAQVPPPSRITAFYLLPSTPPGTLIPIPFATTTPVQLLPLTSPPNWVKSPFQPPPQPS